MGTSSNKRFHAKEVAIFKTYLLKINRKQQPSKNIAFDGTIGGFTQKCHCSGIKIVERAAFQNFQHKESHVEKTTNTC